jgi:hypothetical protein
VDDLELLRRTDLLREMPAIHDAWDACDKAIAALLASPTRENGARVSLALSVLVLATWEEGHCG